MNSMRNALPKDKRNMVLEGIFAPFLYLGQVMRSKVSDHHDWIANPEPEESSEDKTSR
jgi:hypothetical protein